MNLDKYKKRGGFKWFKYQWEFARRSDEYRFIYKNKVGLPSEIKQMLPDPALSFDQVLQQKESEKQNSLLGFINALQFLASGAVRFESLSDGKLVIEIDFKKINSITSLKEYVKELISSHYSVLRKLKEMPAKRKRNMRDYDKILKIGNLREHGDKFETIAAEIDLKRYNSNPYSAVTNVKTLYKEYAELVNGGWKELTFP